MGEKGRGNLRWVKPEEGLSVAMTLGLTSFDVLLLFTDLDFIPRFLFDLLPSVRIGGNEKKEASYDLKSDICKNDTDWMPIHTSS